MNHLSIYKKFDNGSFIMLIDNSKERYLATQNLDLQKSVYGEKIIKLEDVEYRIWEPFRSKLAAAILRNLEENPIKESSSVLCHFVFPRVQVDALNCLLDMAL